MSTRACVGVAIVTAISAFCHAQVDALQLARTYSMVNSLKIVYKSNSEDTRPVEWRHVIQSADGRFSEIVFTSVPPSTAPSRLDASLATHAVYYLSDRVVTSDPTFASHAVQPITRNESDRGSGRAPWPLVPRWIDCVIGHEGLVTTADAGLTTATNSACGIAMTWDTKGRLRGYGDPPGTAGEMWYSYSYAASDSASASPLTPPSSVRLEFNVPSKAGGVTRSHVEWTVERWEINPPDAERWLDPAPLIKHTNRYDPSTSNVYAPDGTLIRNDREFLRRLDRSLKKQTGWRNAAWIAVGCVALLSGVFAWRRYRGG